MSTSSIPRSVNLIDDVSTEEQFTVDSSRRNKHAALEKCKSFVLLRSNTTNSVGYEPKVNFQWYKQLRRNARTLIKSKSDANIKSRKMQQREIQQPAPLPPPPQQQYTNKSVNRNGTIARNHFRGVPGDFLEKQTRHFLLSMTVSILYL